jgi:hypothetical protein
MNRNLDRSVKAICIAVLVVIPLLAVGAVPAFADDPTWQGEYFANPDLAGGPVMVRSDPQISFDWGGGSPAPNIPPDYFSVRWVRNVDFAQDNYRFYVNHDDGVRVFFDGNLIIDNWVDGANSSSAAVGVSGGTHNLRVEYFERTGNAYIHFWWSSATPQVGNLVSCVFPPPSSSWLKVYQQTPGGAWQDMRPEGYGAMSPDGHLKIDGLPVDSSFGSGGNPYRVELWDAGSMVTAVGNVVGEPPFLLLPNTDNYTPWQCGNMPNP